MQFSFNLRSSSQHLELAKLFVSTNFVWAFCLDQDNNEVPILSACR